jgi:long-chain acyl-CoA synthetase
MNRKFSYQELSNLTNRAAKGFQKLGVRPGVHVGGVMKAGGTIVKNYSPLDAEKVLEHKVEDGETDILVTLDLKALYPQMGRLLEKIQLNDDDPARRAVSW